MDLTNSDALAIARSVDPRGWWTIGSLTKLELGMHTFKLTGFMYLHNLGFVPIRLHGNLTLWLAHGLDPRPTIRRVLRPSAEDV